MAVSRLLGESTGLPTLLPKASSAACAVPTCPTPSLIPAMHEGPTCAHCTPQRSPAETVLCSSCSNCTTRFGTPKSQSDLQAKLSIRHAKLTHCRDVVLEAVMLMCGVAGAATSAGARLHGWLDVLLRHYTWQREVAANNWRKREPDQQWKVLNPGAACPNPEAVAHLPLVFRLRDMSSRAASTGFLARAAVCSSRNCNASRMMPTS